LIYELCTGRLPFVAPSAVALTEMKNRSAPDPMRVRSRALGIPPALDRAVMKALAPRAEDRYANATEFRRDLERVFALPGRRRAASRYIGYAAIASATLFAIGVLAAPRRAARTTSATFTPVVNAELFAPPVIAKPTTTSTASPSPTPSPTPAPIPTALVTRSAPRPVHTAHVAERKPADPVATALGAGTSALESGSPAEALEIHRALAKQHPEDARVQRAWAESAAAMRNWSEAIEASESWAYADPSVEPRLFLARMLAYSGRRKAAIRILENVIEAHPEADEARALLRDYRGDEAPPPVSSARAERDPNERSEAH